MDQVDYLLEALPNTRSVELIYRASKDGWSPLDFHRTCDGKGATLCLFRSSLGYLSAGYTSKPWGSEIQRVEDPDAFLCVLTNKLQILRQTGSKKSKITPVMHLPLSGPRFGGFGVFNDPLHRPHGGSSYPDDIYERSMTEDGRRNSLTGHANGLYFRDTFTCVEIEVFLIK